jgi:hypothetical protein
MRCLNSPSILNSLETKIVETTPAGARHVLVVNAGDGRLARAIKEKLGAEAVISVVTIQPGMLGFVDDFPQRSANPWDLAWYASLTQKHGAFDYIVLFQLQEFWHGELHQLHRLLRLAKPGATVWASLLNAQAQRLIARFLPPVRLGFWCLADPVRCVTNIDFASLLDFVGKASGGMTELWGMLDQNAQEFCQKQPGKPVQWDLRGSKVSVGTFADAYLWGAPVVAVAFQTRSTDATAPQPKISYSAYSGNLLQSLLIPYPDYQGREAMLATAELEVEAWAKSPTAEVGSLPRLLIDKIGGVKEPKRVLLLGCGWGRELLALKQQFPAWDWVGIDRDAELVALGKDLVAAGGVATAAVGADGAFPFPERSFDVALSLGCFSAIHEAAAAPVAREALRVSRGSVYHLEDGRGPDQGMQLKSYSLKSVYSEIGSEVVVQPVLVDGAPTGMYILEVAARP